MAVTQVEELQLELTAKIDKLLDRMSKVDKRIKKTATETKTSNKKMQSAFRETAASIAAFQGPLGPVAGRINAMGAAVGRAGPVLAGLGIALAGLTIGLKTAVQAAAKYNREVLRLDGITRATGFSAELSSASINKFAKDLGEATLTSASAAREAAGIIATFKSITGDTFKSTLSLAQDMSEAGFGALKQTALQLAKALEEPIEGINALRRSGVSFTQVQKDMIKGFVESGDKAKAQAEILKVVNEQVGGTGVKAAQDLAGAVDTLGERWDRLWEQLGNTLPAKAAAKAINFLSDSLAALLEKVEELEDGTKLFTDVLEANEAVLRRNGIEIKNFAGQTGSVIRAFMAGIKSQGLDLEANLKFTKLQTNIINIGRALQGAEMALTNARKSSLASETQIKSMVQRVADLNLRLKEETALLRDTATGHLMEANALKASNEAKSQAANLLTQDRKLRAEVNSEEKEFAGLLKASMEALDPMGAALENFISAEERLNEISMTVNATEEERSRILQFLSQQMSAAVTAEEERTTKVEEEAAKRRELEQQALRDRLARLEEQWMTEEQLLEASFGRQNELVQEALEAGAISEAEAYDRRLKLLENFHKARDNITRTKTKTELKNWGGFFGSMMTLTEGRSKSLFKVFKALNLATALTSTFAAVNKAMAEVPWPANLAAAASALASGLANVSSIKSTNFSGGGGGGGSTPSVGGGGAAPSAPAAPESIAPGGRVGAGTNVNINLGDEEGLIPKSAVRNLIEQINEQIEDGAFIQSIRVT